MFLRNDGIKQIHTALNPEEQHQHAFVLVRIHVSFGSLKVLSVVCYYYIQLVSGMMFLKLTVTPSRDTALYLL